MEEKQSHNIGRLIRRSPISGALLAAVLVQVATIAVWQAGSAEGGPALERILKPPLGLPPVVYPAENPPTPEKIALGRKLFLDRRLSKNGHIACATCHVPEQGFTQNARALPIGHLGQKVRRNAPTLLNVAYYDRLFLDGRETSLETQFLLPLTAANEMASQSIGFTIEKIGWFSDYDGLFEAAFGGGPTTDRIGAALASYQRSLVSAASRFDKWLYGARKDALSPQEVAGFKLFTGRAKCASCHQIGETSATFTDQAFHDTGYGWMRYQERRKAGEAPADLGRFEVTGDPLDRWRYRTPTLRNIALTAPYMHDGGLNTLEDVVRFYDQGGAPHDGQDVRIEKRGLSENEISALTAFMRALSGDNINQLISEARKAQGHANKK